MTRFREIGVQTEEEDDVFDISQTTTLQRGSLTSPTASGHQPGILARVRNSFSSQKVKELKRQLRQCEDDIGRLNTLLQSTSQENLDVNLRLNNIVQTNPFNVYITGAFRNVQVGESNTIVDSRSTETLVADLEELTGKLTSAVQENTQERTNAEVKLRNNEVLLREMKESLEICKKALDRLDRSTSNKLGQVKHLLESLTLDRSDARVIADGIDKLRQFVIDRRRMVRSAEGIPWEAQVAVTRLVNKFGNQPWQEFANMIDVSESSIQPRASGENAEHAEGTEFLDKDMCARVLAQWIRQSDDNNAEKLLNLVQVYETRLSQEMTETFQKKTVGQSLIPKVALLHEPEQRSSMSCSDTSGGSGNSGMSRAPSQQLPDKRTQFMHQLEAWKLQVDMNGKLEYIIQLIEKQTKSVRKEMKIKQEDAFNVRAFDEGQFV